MRKTYVVLAYVLAAEVIVQAAAIAFALAGLGHWIDDNHVLTKHVMDKGTAHFTGDVGFPVHAINGEMLIPLITIALLVVSFFAGIDSGRKFAGIVFGLVVLQILLGVSLGDVPALAPLHALNAFGIFAMAIVAGRRARLAPAEPAVAVPA